MIFKSAVISDFQTYLIEREKIVDEAREYFQYKNFQLKAQYYELYIYNVRLDVWQPYAQPTIDEAREIFKIHKDDIFKIETLNIELKA